MQFEYGSEKSTLWWFCVDACSHNEKKLMKIQEKIKEDPTFIVQEILFGENTDTNKFEGIIKLHGYLTKTQVYDLVHTKQFDKDKNYVRIVPNYSEKALREYIFKNLFLLSMPFHIELK